MAGAYWNKCSNNISVEVEAQSRSQDFLWGGGGCVPQESGPNILMFE